MGLRLEQVMPWGRSLDEYTRMLLDLECRRSGHLEPVMDHLRAAGAEVEVVRVDYEFQRGGNEMLRFRK